jgi:hypothetical protein
LQWDEEKTFAVEKGRDYKFSRKGKMLVTAQLKLDKK